MDQRRSQAVQNWLKYRAGLEQAARGHENAPAPPLSMEEIRRRAVAAWRRLQARGEESRSSAASGQEREAGRDAGPDNTGRDNIGRDNIGRGSTGRDIGRDRGEAAQVREPPALGDDFS